MAGELHRPYRRRRPTATGSRWAGAPPASPGPGLDPPLNGAGGQARYYDPALGRFLSIDPVEFSAPRPDMFNRYAYAANDPVNMIDPDGRAPDMNRLAPSEADLVNPTIDVWGVAGSTTVTVLGYLPVTGTILGIADFLKEPSWGGALAILPYGRSARAGLNFSVSVAANIVQGGATNAAAHAAYKAGLRASMAKPAVSDPQLAALLNNLYREGASVGSGSTAAAVRRELATGEPTGGRFHSIKATDGIRSLQRWLRDNPTASPGDRAAAENVILDMSSALGGQ